MIEKRFGTTPTRFVRLESTETKVVLINNEDPITIKIAIVKGFITVVELHHLLLRFKFSLQQNHSYRVQ